MPYGGRFCSLWPCGWPLQCSCFCRARSPSEQREHVSCQRLGGTSQVSSPTVARPSTAGRHGLAPDGGTGDGPPRGYSDGLCRLHPPPSAYRRASFDETGTTKSLRLTSEPIDIGALRPPVEARVPLVSPPRRRLR